jgi:hypothetical protein
LVDDQAYALFVTLWFQQDAVSGKWFGLSFVEVELCIDSTENSTGGDKRSVWQCPHGDNS